MHSKHTCYLLGELCLIHTHIKAAGSKPVPKAAAWDG